MFYWYNSKSWEKEGVMKKYICELLGTCVLVLFGCGTACIPGTLFQISPIITPFAFGLAIVAMAYAIGHVSGCHVNPAVSLAMLLNKRMNGKDFAGYVIAQFIGAFIGSAILFLIMQQSSIVSQYGVAQFGLGANGYDSASLFGINMTGAIIVEIILTFVFVLTVLGVAASEKMASVAGIVIGLSLTFVHILGIPLTGTSVNPARSFGPALMTFIATQDSTSLSQLWVFIVAPLLGGVLAAGFWSIVCVNKKKIAPKEPKLNPKSEPKVEDKKSPSEEKTKESVDKPKPKKEDKAGDKPKPKEKPKTPSDK